MTDTTTVCRCGRPTRDAAYTCDECSQSLAVALGDVPWLVEQLDITATRAKGVDYRTKGATRASERPSPVVWGASEARGHLRAVLVSWTLWSAQEGVRNQSPTQDLPADTLEAMSRWLAWRIDGLALHDTGPEAVEQIVAAVNRCRRVVDRPVDRQYLGACDLCQRVGDNGRLYGKPGSAMATCDVCGYAIDAAERREKLLADLDDRLCTAAEIARLSTYLGLKADREQVRKRINQWSARGVLAHQPSVTEEATFRFGTVYRMLVADEYAGRRKGAA